MFSLSVDDASCNARRKGVKKGFNPEEARKKREEESFTIRKQKREETLMKRRNVAARQESPSMSCSSSVFQNLAEVMAALRGADTARKIEAAIYLRKLLSATDTPPITSVVQAGAVPLLIENLWREDCPELQLECCWALTNIGSGEAWHTEELCKNGAGQALVSLLARPSIELRDQAIWALGNITGESARLRDYVLSIGALEPMLETITLAATSVPVQPGQKKLLGNGAWSLSNLFRHKPALPATVVQRAMPTLAAVLSSLPACPVSREECDALVDSLWAMSFATADPEGVRAALSTGVMPRILAIIMACDDYTYTLPSLRAVGNVLASTHEATSAMLEAGALAALEKLAARGSKRTVRKETFWAVSNVAAGTHSHITALLQQSGLMTSVVDGLRNGDSEERKEACWAISNMAAGGNSDHLSRLVDVPGAVAGLCGMLTRTQDVKLLKAVLDGLKSILRVGKICAAKVGVSENPYARLVEESHGLEALEELQSHENMTIYERTVEILEEYFEAEERENGVDNCGSAEVLSSKATSFGAPPVAPGFAFNFSQQ